MRVRRALEGSEAQFADKIRNCIERVRFYARLTETKISETRTNGLQPYFITANYLSFFQIKPHCEVIRKISKK